jgi:hypothetical protein
VRERPTTALARAQPRTVNEWGDGAAGGGGGGGAGAAASGAIVSTTSPVSPLAVVGVVAAAVTGAGAAEREVCAATIGEALATIIQMKARPDQCTAVARLHDRNQQISAADQ